MNNNYDYNNQPIGGMPNQNMNGPQPMNYGPQPMPNQGMNNGQMNNMNPGYGYNFQQKPPFKFPAIAKDKVSIIGYIGAIILAIGSLLDFVSIKVGLGDYNLLDETINYFSTNGEAKDGVFILVLAIIALGLVHFRKNLLALIPTGISGAILMADIIDMNERIAELEGLYGTNSYLSYNIETSFGPAPYIVGIGIALLVIHAVMYWLEKKKPQTMMSSPSMSGMAQPMNYGPQPMPNQGMNYGQPNNQYPQNNQYPNNNMMM